ISNTLGRMQLLLSEFINPSRLNSLYSAPSQETAIQFMKTLSEDLDISVNVFRSKARSLFPGLKDSLSASISPPPKSIPPASKPKPSASRTLYYILDLPSGHLRRRSFPSRTNTSADCSA